jgi:hypothetical protein
MIDLFVDSRGHRSMTLEPPFAVVDLDGRPALLVRDPRDAILAIAASPDVWPELAGMRALAEDERQLQGLIAARLWSDLEDCGDRPFVRFEDRPEFGEGPVYAGAVGAWREQLHPSVADATLTAIPDVMKLWGYLPE